MKWIADQTVDDYEVDDDFEDEVERPKSRVDMVGFTLSRSHLRCLD